MPGQIVSPAVGERAPEFTLPGPGGRAVSLAELLRGGTVVLYFYPKDQTPGCTMEACAFRDDIDAFSAAGAQVVGISRDDEASHARFAAKHKLPFLLLSDTTGETHARYGVTKKLGFIPDRMTFVIDQQRHRAPRLPVDAPDARARRRIAGHRAPAAIARRPLVARHRRP